MNKPKRVLILCTGNSARSQMAEGILRHDGGDAFEVHSAGVKPSSVRPEAILVMREIGIDISRYWSKSADEFIGQDFGTVITVCDSAKETCPVFPRKTERIHQSFEDPPPPGVGSDDVPQCRGARVTCSALVARTGTTQLCSVVVTQVCVRSSSTSPQQLRKRPRFLRRSGWVIALSTGQATR